MSTLKSTDRTDIPSRQSRASSRIASQRNLPDHKQNPHCLICCQDLDVGHAGSKDRHIHGPVQRAKIFDVLCFHLRATYNPDEWKFRIETLPFCTSCAKSTANILEFHDQIEVAGAKLKILLESITKKIIYTSKVERVFTDFGYFGKDTKFAAFHNEVVNNVTFTGLDEAIGPSEIKIISRTIPDKWFHRLLDPIVTVEPMPNLQLKAEEGKGRTSADITRRCHRSRKQREWRNAQADIWANARGATGGIGDDAKLEVADHGINGVEIKQECLDEEISDPLEHKHWPLNSDGNENAGINTFEEPEPQAQSVAELPCRAEHTVQSVRYMHPDKCSIPTILLPNDVSRNDDDDSNDPSWTSDQELSKKEKMKRLSMKKKQLRIKNRELRKHGADGSEMTRDSSTDNGRGTQFFNTLPDGRLVRNGFVVIKVDSGYQCTTCQEVVEKRQMAVDHVKSVHLGREFKCKECGKIFTRKRSLLLHMEIHKCERAEKVKVDCEICGRPFKLAKTLSRHIWTHMSQEEIDVQEGAGRINPLPQLKVKYKPKKYPCLVCGKPIDQRYLPEHESNHTRKREERTFVCTKCPTPKKYWTAKQLYVHDIGKHRIDQNQFQCNICLKGFPSRIQLKKHTWIHTGEKPYVCHVCGRGFRSPLMCRDHQVTHGEGIGSYKCDKCFKTYSWKTSLRRHKETCKIGEDSPSAQIT